MTPLADHALQQIQLYRWKRRQYARHYGAAQSPEARLQWAALLQGVIDCLNHWRRVHRICADFEFTKD